MTAARHVNAQQLAMFMPARDLIKVHPHPGDLDQHREYLEEMREQDAEDGLDPGPIPNNKELTASLWENKLDESGEQMGNEPEALWNNIDRTRRVDTPVYISHQFDEPAIASGHHRIAAAADIDASIEIPVEHYNSLSIATARGRHDQDRWNSYGDTERPHGPKAEGQQPKMHARVASNGGIEFGAFTQTPTSWATRSDEASDDYYARALARGRL